MNEKDIEKLEFINVDGSTYLGFFTKNEDGSSQVVGVESFDMKKYLIDECLGDLITVEIVGSIIGKAVKGNLVFSSEEGWVRKED